MSKTKQWIGLVGFLALCFAAAAAGSLVTVPRIEDWYGQLRKPTWTPPSWLFGPVWTVLYAMMAVAAWLVWRRDGFWKARWPLTCFGIQLLLNTLWSVLFFGLRRPDLAAVEIGVLWLAIAATSYLFAQRSRLAGGLLLPYLAWVTFAAALNLSIWRLNSDADVDIERESSVVRLTTAAPPSGLRPSVP